MIEKITVYDNITALREVNEHLPIFNCAFEIILNCLGVPPLILAIYLFSNIKIFHFNLTVLLNDLMAAYLIRTLIRTIVCFLISVEIFDNFSKREYGRFRETMKVRGFRIPCTQKLLGFSVCNLSICLWHESLVNFYGKILRNI